MNLLPLFLAWMWHKHSGATPAPAPLPTPPPWPTTSSPPPMPAFAAQTPAAPNPTADSGTPLSALHADALAPPGQTAPKTPAAHTTSIPTTPQAAARAASRAVKKKAHSAASSAASRLLSPIPGVKLPNPFGHKHRAAAVDMRSEPVADLQGILIQRGATLTRDGLYGPKTAQAWTALAKQKGLPGQITRVGPKVASVAAQTFDALAVPPIP